MQKPKAPKQAATAAATYRPRTYVRWWDVSSSSAALPTMKGARATNTVKTAACTVPIVVAVSARRFGVAAEHHGLHGSDDHWWCLGESGGGFGVGQRLWANARATQVVAGFNNPRSRTALVRVGTAA